MTKLGGTKAWVATAGVALLMAFMVVPALSGAASAAPITSATASSPAAQWAYGGEGWSNNTLVLGNTTLIWNAMFGWSVIFTATSSNGTTMLEEQRTVGVTIAASASDPTHKLTYNFHAQEVDAAFANLTNASVVYVNGQAVPALGILNASASVQTAIDQSISATANGQTRSASFDATGAAQAAVSFAPSLGLIPLNLSGVSVWNSSATASPSASWNVAWTWNEQGFNGTSGSGSGSKAGNLSASGTVNLTGYKFTAARTFDDHVPRVGILLVIQGPFDSYDGFVLVPHDFDLFGDATQEYSSVELGSAGISAERLYVGEGPHGPTIGAADTTFGSSNLAVTAAATPVVGPTPAATSSPGTTVQAQPMSPAQAQSVANGLTQNGGSSPASKGGALLVGLLVAAVAVAVATFGVVEWRAYARRREQRQLVGGYSATWNNGVPPAAAFPPAPQGPAAPANPPATVEDPNRPL